MNAMPLFQQLFTAPIFQPPQASRSNNAHPFTYPDAPIIMPPKQLFQLQAPTDISATSTTSDTPILHPEAPSQHFRDTLNRSASPRPSLNPNPFARTTQQTDSKRREAFLNKVQQNRDDARWNTRSEQILQMDYLSQRRAWEAEQARTAPAFDPDELDDTDLLEMHDPSYTSQRQETQVSSQPPWYDASASQDSKGASVEDAQQMQFSQMSLSLDTDEARMPDEMEQAEIDAFLEAEAREMEALIAMHESASASSGWAELPKTHEVKPGFGRALEGVDAGQIFSSSPMWGSDDSEFEEELWRLGGDAMDTSGGS